jgi:ribosomal protein L37AE/L43A
MKTEIWKCDIDKCENSANHKGLSIQVIFTTEQTEGRNTKPHLSNEKIDICQSCLDKVLEGNYIFGAGAMGHNCYTLK